MALDTWTRRRAMTPEEKAAKKAAAKEQLKDARKTASANEKELTKKADEATKRAETENTPEAHKAAAEAHSKAAAAYSHHYLNLRGGLAIHDRGSLHGTHAQFHTFKAGELEKAKQPPSQVHRSGFGTGEAAPKMDAPDKSDLMPGAGHFGSSAHGASEFGFTQETSARRAYDKGNRDQGHALARQAVTAFMQAHNRYIDEGNTAQAKKAEGDAVRVSKKADFHGAGINFNPDTHPRDEKGRFTSK